jgi:diguanylate cyclase (GGDEF)-like protein
MVIARQARENRLDVLIPTMLNKRATSEQLEKRIRENETFGLFLIDLNNFKLVNDLIGHAAGDQLLVRFGELVDEMLQRRTDELGLADEDEVDQQGRIGGDEFIIMAGPFEDGRRETDPEKQMYQEYDRLRTIESILLAENPRLAGKEIQFGLAIGSALFDRGHPVDAATLLAQADEAMYEEKAGKPIDMSRASHTDTEVW